MTHSHCAVCDKCKEHVSIDSELFSLSWYTVELPANPKEHPVMRKTVHFCSYLCLLYFMQDGAQTNE